ncbi:MAG: hypothetical protein ACRCTR_08040 [Actinomycetota bacterium]
MRTRKHRNENQAGVLAFGAEELPVLVLAVPDVALSFEVEAVVAPRSVALALSLAVLVFSPAAASLLPPGSPPPELLPARESVR